jgi:hypothetical protein
LPVASARAIATGQLMREVIDPPVETDLLEHLPGHPRRLGPPGDMPAAPSSGPRGLAASPGADDAAPGSR